MEKKRSFAQWQKIWPDAIKIEANANSLLSGNEILKIAYGNDWQQGIVLQDTSSAIWTQKSGIKATIRAIVSKDAKQAADNF